MSLTPEGYAKRLIEASQKKFKLLQDVFAITEAQSQAIHEDGIDKLEAFVVQKQVIIDSINKVDEEFDVYYNRLKQELKFKSLGEINEAEIKGIKELQYSIDKILNLINDISVIEKQNNTCAKNLLNGFSNEIIKLQQAKKVNTTYGTPVIQNPSYYLDKKK